MKQTVKLERTVIAIVSAFVLLSCNLPISLSAPAADPSMEETRIAVGIQQTMIAVRETELAAVPQEPSAAPTEPPVEVVVTATPAPPTETPPPLEPTWTNVPPETAVPEPSPTTENMEDRIRAANILVFEDIRGYYDLTQWVHSAMNGMDFSGGKVLEVGDAVGDFMKALNSPVEWDLIIVAAEARSGVRGEFWDVIQDQVNDDVALIAEVWYLDDTANGRIAPLLAKCGVSYQKDFWRDPDKYDVLNYSLYWLDQHHELFSNPNVVEPLYTPSAYWVRDVGDLLRLSSGGDAELLSGLYPNEKSRYGVIASCLDGRVIFQTFSTHDYRQSQMIPLWQNYITYTLTNHFETLQE